MSKFETGEPMRYAGNYIGSFMSKKTKSELRSAHGTPYEFALACERAVANREMTRNEAAEAVGRYSIEYEEAPNA